LYTAAQGNCKVLRRATCRVGSPQDRPRVPYVQRQEQTMRRKLTITVDDDVYEGLYRV
jgi:hypothetical protein